ncbi:WecB/TagA/CpsF family glycosyltransferase [Stratiformator vulcanicus]|uniref:UDP-N-acetyl-D-mannosaminuronic acid transferase n=1 Tax=Stratiformator vulcanicus TaxID=2527980 RepID=A0A517QW59_9PLAN|nr:WecB/TagA/CpsF family glycosyltransferase [Stratiformator vulcanicus]QDT35899.1 UDP-N-acetyl-D-mannosaminuronic acid transferase [Stratiformator vulcanicus]
MSVAELPTVSPALEYNERSSWPPKVDVFGLQVSPTNYREATESIIEAAREHRPAVVSCHAVHALITFSGNPELRAKANTFAMITPDGQPVRWALNLLHGTKLGDRVYGPDLTLSLCQAAAEEGVSIYLYGGTPDVLASLEHNLVNRFPALEIAGSESPPFRTLTPDEDAAVVERINRSGAGLVFIGLGCPKQDLFAFDHRERIDAVQVCVGAAFDFHAGVKRTAPPWMQRTGLEWLFRLCEEPKRLWKRYFVTNSIYLGRLTAALLNVPNIRRQHRIWRDRKRS